MKRNLQAVCFLSAVLLAFFLGGAVPTGSVLVPSIDRQVWANTQNGDTANFIVVLRDQAAVRSQAVPYVDRSAARSELVADLRRTAGQSQKSLLSQLHSLGAESRPFWIVNAVAVKGNRAVLEALAQRGDVLRIEPDPAFRVDLPQPAPAQDCLSEGTPWGLVRIHAPELWEQGVTGEGIVIANADTGVEWDHPQLMQQYRGWDGSQADHDYNWWDAVHTDIDGIPENACGLNSPVPCDDHGHGTHTTGTAIGEDTGAAPGAKWIACRNMDSGVGRPSTYIECLQFFLAPTDLQGNNPDPSLAPDVVGNSYACPPYEGCNAYSLYEAVQTVRSAGIFMAVAAGNEANPFENNGCSTVIYPPAIYDSVFTVGASQGDDQIFGPSSRGPVTVDGSGRLKPDLVAPGVGVCSANSIGGTIEFSGTSMAAPHVAGGVALLWSASPGLRGQVDQTEGLLRRSALPLTTALTCGNDQPGSSPNNIFGYGLLDVYAAYQELPQGLRYYFPWIVR